MEYLIIFLLIILFWILDNKKLVNIKAIFDSLIYVILILFELVIILLCIIKMTDMHLDIWIFIMIFSILVILLLVSIYLLSDHISGGFRTIYYLMNKNKFFKNGKVIIGKIVNIKKNAQSRYYIKRYLIVNVDGKIIKSTYYLDDKYKIGKNIKVVKYKNKYLVLV